MKNVEVYIEKCRENAILPTYAHIGDSGMDVYASEEVLIHPGETRIVPIGFKFAIPLGYELQARPRSGLSLNTPLRLSNAPGTIDSGYRNEVGIILTNTSTAGSCATATVDAPLTLDNKGNQHGTYLIRHGDRIAQLVLQEVPVMQLIPVASVADIGDDRQGGFGSTGTR